jgi:hypothetical protein
MRPLLQRASVIYGVVFVIIAIIGFFTSRGSMESDPAMAPRIFGLFPVNLIHNLFHLGWGIWGLAAARAWVPSHRYLSATAVVYILLALLAFITPNGFGLLPIGSHDIWLHALLGIVAGAVVLAAGQEEVRTATR